MNLNKLLTALRQRANSPAHNQPAERRERYTHALEQFLDGQLVLAQRNQVHRDMDGVRQGADGSFLVGAHVQQMERAAFFLPLLQLQRGELRDRHDVVCVK